MLIDDPNARKRSLMHQQKSLCNGEATGRPCKYYWYQLTKITSNNPDILNKGEIQRACLLTGQALPMESEELAVECNQYKPNKKLKYNSEQEEYTPITPEEYKEIQKQFPSEIEKLIPKSDVIQTLPVVQNDEEKLSYEDITDALSALGEE